MNKEQREGQRILAYILKSLGFRVKTKPAGKRNLGMVITVDPCIEGLVPVYVRERHSKMWN